MIMRVPADTLATIQQRALAAFAEAEAEGLMPADAMARGVQAAVAMAWDLGRREGYRLGWDDRGDQELAQTDGRKDLR